MATLRAEDPEDPEDLQPTNLWESISGPLAESYLEDLIQILDDDQFQMVEGLRRAKGPIHLVTGPAGTGKTKLAVEIIMRALSKTPVLVLSPTKSGANCLARVLKTTFDQYREKPNEHPFLPEDPNEFMILRYSGDEIERQILKDAAQLQNTSNEDSTGHDQQSSDSVSADNSDPGIDTPEVSVGYAIGVFCEIIKKDNGECWSWAQPDDPQCVAFRRHFDNYSKAKGSNEGSSYDHRSAFNLAFKDMRAKILGFARVICTTAATPLEKDLHNFRPEMIVMDDANGIADPDGWGIFSLYRSSKMFLLLGDPQLPRPEVNWGCSQLTSLLRLSIFMRLQRAGVSTTHLRVQHRSCPQLAAIFHRIFYANQEDTMSMSP